MDITALHINHSYPEYGDKKKMLQCKERQENLRLYKETGCDPGYNHWGSITDAPYILNHGEIRMKELETQLESEINSFKRKEINIWITYYKGIVESLNELELIMPTVSFNNKITFKGSGRTVEIIHCGEAHTASDTTTLIDMSKFGYLYHLLSFDY